MVLKLVGKSDSSVPFVDIDHLAWLDGNLLSSDSGGAIKAWSPELKLLDEFHPHDEYPVYHLATDEANKRLFTCSSDAKIHEWGRESGKWTKINTLEGHDGETIRRLYVRGNQLFSGDEAGRVNVWENGKLLASFDLMEEIWDMLVIENVLVTVRNRDIVVNEMVLSQQETYRCCMKKALEGRAPLCLTENRLCFAERNGMDILVANQFRSNDSLKTSKFQGHKLIVNALVGFGDKLFSGGWDKKVVAWDLQKSGIIGEVETDGYINALNFASNSGSGAGGGGRLYVAGENSFIGIIELS